MNQAQRFLARVATSALAVAVSFSAASLHAQEHEENSPAALPPGMTGSTTVDPRVGLKAGMYDAGEAAMGMEHVAFLKKPDAFQLGTNSADDPIVQKALKTLGRQ